MLLQKLKDTKHVLIMHLQSEIGKDWSFHQTDQFIQLDQKFDINILLRQ